MSTPFPGSKVQQAVYHGTSKEFTRLSIKHSAQGLIWFASDRAGVESGEHGNPTGITLELYVDLQRPAGWDEYQKQGIWELKRNGFDGAVLPNEDGSFTGFVFSSRQVRIVARHKTAKTVIEALVPIPTARRGYMGGAGSHGQFVGAPVEDVIATDHSELGVRRRRWRWAHGAPDTIFWTDTRSGDDEFGDFRDEVAHWVQQRTGKPVARHRFFPEGWQTWRSRISAAEPLISAETAARRAGTVAEAMADELVMPDGATISYHTGYPFLWLGPERVEELKADPDDAATLEEFCVNEGTGLCVGKLGWTHGMMGSLGLVAGRAPSDGAKTKREGRIWPEEGAVAFWQSQDEVTPGMVQEIVEQFQDDPRTVGDPENFALSFGDDPNDARVERLVGDWLDAGRDDLGSEEAAAQTEVGHVAHLLGARAAGRPSSGIGSDKAAALAGTEPVAAWRARRSTSEALIEELTA